MVGVRYGVMDYNGKLAFVSWIPDNGKAMAKMKYASAKEGFANELQGISAKIQATDDGELTLDIIKEKCKSKV